MVVYDTDTLYSRHLKLSQCNIQMVGMSKENSGTMDELGICRICTKTYGLVSMFTRARGESKENRNFLRKMIMETVGIRIESYHTITSVCITCIVYVVNFYSFKFCCTETNERLRNEKTFEKFPKPASRYRRNTKGINLVAPKKEELSRIREWVKGKNKNCKKVPEDHPTRAFGLESMEHSIQTDPLPCEEKKTQTENDSFEQLKPCLKDVSSQTDEFILIDWLKHSPYAVESKRKRLKEDFLDEVILQKPLGEQKITQKSKVPRLSMDAPIKTSSPETKDSSSLILQSDIKHKILQIGGTPIVFEDRLMRSTPSNTTSCAYADFAGPETTAEISPFEQNSGMFTAATSNTSSSEIEESASLFSQSDIKQEILDIDETSAHADFADSDTSVETSPFEKKFRLSTAASLNTSPLENEDSTSWFFQPVMKQEKLEIDDASIVLEDNYMKSSQSNFIPCSQTDFTDSETSVEIFPLEQNSTLLTAPSNNRPSEIEYSTSWFSQSEIKQEMLEVGETSHAEFADSGKILPFTQKTFPFKTVQVKTPLLENSNKKTEKLQLLQSPTLSENGSSNSNSSISSKYSDLLQVDERKTKMVRICEYCDAIMYSSRQITKHHKRHMICHLCKKKFRSMKNTVAHVEKCEENLSAFVLSKKDASSSS